MYEYNYKGIVVATRININILPDEIIDIIMSYLDDGNIMIYSLINLCQEYSGKLLNLTKMCKFINPLIDLINIIGQEDTKNWLCKLIIHESINTNTKNTANMNTLIDKNIYYVNELTDIVANIYSIIYARKIIYCRINDFIAPWLGVTYTNTTNFIEKEKNKKNSIIVLNGYDYCPHDERWFECMRVFFDHARDGNITLICIATNNYKEIFNYRIFFSIITAEKYEKIHIKKILQKETNCNKFNFDFNKYYHRFKSIDYIRFGLTLRRHIQIENKIYPNKNYIDNSDINIALNVYDEYTKFASVLNMYL